MSLTATNTTCDIYRSTNAPPLPPDVPAVACYLKPAGGSTLTTSFFTHVLLAPPGTDVRDDFTYGQPPSAGPDSDKVYIPDSNGVRYTVVLIRRVGQGTALEHMEVLLQRAPGQEIDWTTNNV